MFVQALTVLLPSVLQAAASRCPDQSIFKTSDECPKGVYIIGVRGTLEDPGYGAMQPVVDSIMDKFPGSDSKAIEYPAGGITVDEDGEVHMNFTDYKASEARVSPTSLPRLRPSLRGVPKPVLLLWAILRQAQSIILVRRLTETDRSDYRELTL